MAWVCLAVPFWKIFDLVFSPVIFHTVKKDVPQILPFCDTSFFDKFFYPSSIDL